MSSARHSSTFHRFLDGHRWSQQGFMRQPSTIESSDKSAKSDTSVTGPFCDGHGSAVKGNVSAPGSVGALLLASSPSAVSRFVMSRSIDSIERMMLRWLWPHIVIKRDKGIRPPITHSDSDCAIPFIVDELGRSVAASFSSTPCGIFWRVTHPMIFALFALSLCAKHVAHSTMRMA